MERDEINKGKKERKKTVWRHSLGMLFFRGTRKERGTFERDKDYVVKRQIQDSGVSLPILNNWWESTVLHNWASENCSLESFLLAYGKTINMA